MCFPKQAAADKYIGFYNGRNNPQTYSIGISTSNDGYRWSRSHFEFLEPRENMFDSAMLNGPCPVTVGDYVYLYYSGFDGSRISTGLVILNKECEILYRSKNPVLSPGNGLDWDSKNIFRSAILYEPENEPSKRFSMLYGGQGQDDRYQIGLAYSEDGIHWNKYSGKVLTYGSEGQFDSQWVSQPTVTKFNGLYYMGYAGYNGVRMEGGLATANSLEGPWVKLPSNPVLRVNAQASQTLTSHVVSGDTFLKVNDSQVFHVGEPCYLQTPRATEIVRIKSIPDNVTIELTEPVVLPYPEGARIESIFAKSLGPNQIEYIDGKWKIWATTWANMYGYETTAYAEGDNFSNLQWIYDKSPLIYFEPLVRSYWDSISQENLRFIKISDDQ
jgi:predicted GH43/DUF377 family glycosyl hydrolase